MGAGQLAGVTRQLIYAEQLGAQRLFVDLVALAGKGADNFAWRCRQSSQQRAN